MNYPADIRKIRKNADTISALYTCIENIYIYISGITDLKYTA